MNPAEIFELLKKDIANFGALAQLNRFSIDEIATVFSNNISFLLGPKALVADLLVISLEAGYENIRDGLYHSNIDWHSPAFLKKIISDNITNPEIFEFLLRNFDISSDEIAACLKTLTQEKVAITTGKLRQIFGFAGPHFFIDAFLKSNLSFSKFNEFFIEEFFKNILQFDSVRLEQQLAEFSSQELDQKQRDFLNILLVISFVAKAMRNSEIPANISVLGKTPYAAKLITKEFLNCFVPNSGIEDIADRLERLFAIYLSLVKGRDLVLMPDSDFIRKNDPSDNKYYILYDELKEKLADSYKDYLESINILFKAVSKDNNIPTLEKNSFLQKIRGIFWQLLSVWRTQIENGDEKELVDLKENIKLFKALPIACENFLSEGLGNFAVVSQATSFFFKSNNEKLSSGELMRLLDKMEENVEREINKDVVRSAPTPTPYSEHNDL